MNHHGIVTNSDCALENSLDEGTLQNDLMDKQKQTGKYLKKILSNLKLS